MWESKFALRNDRDWPKLSTSKTKVDFWILRWFVSSQRKLGVHAMIDAALKTVIKSDFVFTFGVIIGEVQNFRGMGAQVGCVFLGNWVSLVLI